VFLDTANDARIDLKSSNLTKSLRRDGKRRGISHILTGEGIGGCVADAGICTHGKICSAEIEFEIQRYNYMFSRYYSSIRMKHCGVFKGGMSIQEYHDTEIAIYISNTNECDHGIRRKKNIDRSVSNAD